LKKRKINIIIPKKGEREEVLSGGQRAEKVRKIGSNVHRTQSPNAPFVHQVLHFLSENNFSYSPRFIGIDPENREVLSFIEGEVPREFNLTFNQIQDAFKILRVFHDIMVDSLLTDGAETICHRDFAPWNIIIKKNEVAGIIDFDDATPGSRIGDVAYALWTFLELGTSSVADSVQIAQVVALVNEYGLKDKIALVRALLMEQTRILRFRERMVVSANDPEMRNFSQGAVKRIVQSMNWVKMNSDKLSDALTS
jgi:hypothetical protein